MYGEEGGSCAGSVTSAWYVDVDTNSSPIISIVCPPEVLILLQHLRSIPKRVFSKAWVEVREKSMIADGRKCILIFSSVIGVVLLEGVAWLCAAVVLL